MLGLVGTSPRGVRPVIALNVIGGLEWLFGRVFVKDLCVALRGRYGNEVGLCLLGYSNAPDRLAGFDGLTDEVLTYPVLRRGTPRWLFNLVMRRVFGRDVVGDRYLKRRGVQVVALAHRRWSSIPTVSLFQDFQYVHLPEMFSPPNREELHRGSREIARWSHRVLVYSESVKRDFESIHPEHAHKVRRFSPVTIVPPSVYGGDQPESICDRYHLPRKFVYLPNQFWKHKNHETAFRALQLLKERGTQVFLVCSGYPGDFRHPEHFAELLQKLSLGGLRDQVALLGPVPREQVLSLMRQSVCVLNPSLYEGFGMAVDEARSVGKRVVLSDIPPHREQAPPRAAYFNPRDCEELARALEEVWLTTPPGPDEALEAEASRRQPERVKKYAEDFMAIVREVAPWIGNRRD